MKKEKINLLGAGLIGSLLAIYLRKRGLDVAIYEKREDWRNLDTSGEGRSINMALSYRGWKALEKAGIKDKVIPFTQPMYGRRIHDEHGDTFFQPYGKENQAIYSISRNAFNKILLDEAEEQGASIHFQHKVEQVNVAKRQVSFSLADGASKSIQAEVLIGSDGAYSALRNAFQSQLRFNFNQQYISHGYKELSIPPTPEGGFAMDPNALHIWPRGKFMLIALPNLDKSFTCTLFLPFEGYKVSFANIHDDQDVEQVFKTHFNDAYNLMPTLLKDFKRNPTAALINTECYPWTENNTLLIGDAAHAMVPFYGQGMNCGFEDCSILDGLVGKYGTSSWDLVFEKFQKGRKPDTDAICQLAMDNFVEMSDNVADPKFLIRKKIEARLHELFPEEWVPLYSMVTFSDMKYAEAYAIGKLQEKVMDSVMSDPLITQNWDRLDYEDILHQVVVSGAV
ncbi:MAG: NAD(P)/FAD-dependent oxidoreductase [Cyclobacterium sp.]|uniref:FAD-dependent oxidoreductase n=1 Tax=Cyclobacterium sp. TaxID=1966343 RepID=UPI0039706E2B